MLDGIVIGWLNDAHLWNICVQFVTVDGIVIGWLNEVQPLNIEVQSFIPSFIVISLLRLLQFKKILLIDLIEPTLIGEFKEVQSLNACDTSFNWGILLNKSLPNIGIWVQPLNKPFSFIIPPDGTDISSHPKLVIELPPSNILLLIIVDMFWQLLNSPLISFK